MTSYCDVTNNVYPVTMTTIRHCSILGFGRGASNQAVAPGITRPLHATETSAGILDWAKFMCTQLPKFKLTNTICNNQDNSAYIGNLYTVSTDNPVIMFIFLIYSLVLCWGNISNSNVTMKFAQLHYFLSKCWGGQNILCPPCPKVGGAYPPVTLINSVPGHSWSSGSQK